jgi:hypothetical protein
MDNAERVKRLEEALLDYVERYGATDLARAALRPTEPEDRGHAARAEAPGDQAWDVGCRCRSPARDAGTAHTEHIEKRMSKRSACARRCEGSVSSFRMFAILRQNLIFLWIVSKLLLPMLRPIKSRSRFVEWSSLRSTIWSEPAGVCIRIHSCHVIYAARAGSPFPSPRLRSEHGSRGTAPAVVAWRPHPAPDHGASQVQLACRFAA